MTETATSISLGAWFATPPGAYLLDWEQRHLDEAVADVFGFHALQLGLPQLDALRGNRMPHRWLAVDTPHRSDVLGTAKPPGPRGVALNCDFDALPFDSQSLDLVVLPHALELARDPHQTLREVERVLMPEGRVVIIGFNPNSLWGMRQQTGHARRQLGLGLGKSMFLSRERDLIAYRRLRDWLRLLSFEVETGRFGCYRPPMRSDKWLSRFAWVESAGARWWPVFGAVYALTAVKRVRGMRLVGLVREQRPKAHAAPAVVARNQPHLQDTARWSRERAEPACSDGFREQEPSDVR
ncbi:MAG: methyltransferase domain-containing protein [Rhizobacter sp.]|jgi:SAM-dependent methyltransferase|nr:methyltransferase domain-containing protein [Rhizobacter sp.]MBP6268333.1 methyltransferase domain-containing protein [Rhizobacter sp.]